MQGKDREDILPLAEFGRDSSAAFFRGNRDHMVDNAQTFGFGLGLDGGRFGFSVADAIEPVTDARRLHQPVKSPNEQQISSPRLIHGAFESLVRGTHKDEKGRVVALSDLCLQSYIG